jgi:molecular chaperone GrpE
VKALAEPFDPNFHEAVSELQDNSAKPGTVIQELQKGYTLNERLIRPAMVIVSKNDE